LVSGKRIKLIIGAFEGREPKLNGQAQGTIIWL